MHTRHRTMLRGRLLRSRREDGAVAVETALVSMMLITILFGIVEVSFLMRDAVVVSSASRAGARMASSMTKDLGFTTYAKDQVEDALAGMDYSRVDKVWIYKVPRTATVAQAATPPATCLLTCVAYKGNGATNKLDWVSGVWAIADVNGCIGGSGPPDQVGVYVEYRYKARIGLFDGRKVTESTVMRFEPYTRGACL